MNASPKPGRRDPVSFLRCSWAPPRRGRLFVCQQRAADRAAERATAAQQAVAATRSGQVIVAKATLPAQPALNQDNVEIRDVSSEALPAQRGRYRWPTSRQGADVAGAAKQILTPFWPTPSARCQEVSQTGARGKRAMAVTSPS